MERDFKQEFIELKQNETPDLWKRIEAGLSEKKILEYIPENATVPRKIISWRRWGTLAAACLCVAVVIPAVSLIMRNKSYNYSGSASDSSPADNSADGTATSCEMPDYAEPESAAPREGITGGIDTDAEALNGGTGEGIRADADGSIMSEAQADMSKDDGIAKNSSTVQESDGAGSIAETEKVKDLLENNEYISSLGLENGQVIENIIIQIVEADESGEEVIYQAIVLSPDTDVILGKNIQIEIVCNTDTEYDSAGAAKDDKMKDGESYEVSLRFEQDKLIVTGVTKIN